MLWMNLGWTWWGVQLTSHDEPEVNPVILIRLRALVVRNTLAPPEPGRSRLTCAWSSRVPAGSARPIRAPRPGGRSCLRPGAATGADGLRSGGASAPPVFGFAQETRGTERKKNIA